MTVLNTCARRNVKARRSLHRLNNVPGVGAADERQVEFSLQTVQFFGGVDNRFARPTPQKELGVLRHWTKPMNMYNYIRKIITANQGLTRKGAVDTDSIHFPLGWGQFPLPTCHGRGIVIGLLFKPCM